MDTATPIDNENFVVPYQCCGRGYEAQEQLSRKIRKPEKHGIFTYNIDGIYIDREYYRILMKALLHNGKVPTNFYMDLMLKAMEHEGYIRIINNDGSCSDKNHKYCIIAIREEIYTALKRYHNL